MGSLTASAPSPVMQEAGRKAWITRRANQAARTAATSSMTPSQKAAATRRANKGTVSTPSARATASITTSSRILDLGGTRKLRASVPTLVGHLQNARTIQYYNSPSRSVIVLNN